MPLESASYISQLDVSNPASTDQLAQADDHLRLIKSVLKTTFPNINGVVSSTDEQLSNPSSTLPVGLIMAWYSTSGSIPSGWALCDGGTYARSDGSGTIVTPNLVDRVVVGAGSIASQGSTAGSTTAAGTSSASGTHTHTVDGGSHTHTFVSDGHTLTESEIPAHTHTVSGNPGGSGNHTNVESGIGGTVTPIATSSTGGGAAHSHTGTTAATSHSHSVTTADNHTHSTTVSTIQPSYGLHWIMKV